MPSDRSLAPAATAQPPDDFFASPRSLIGSMELSVSSLTAPTNTPSLDEVRDRIERRYANAMGRAELAGNSVEGRMLEIQKATIDSAGSARLEQIRSSMAGEQLGGAAQRPAVPQAEKTGPANDPTAAARLDELRASMARERGTGDPTAAG